MTIDTSKLKHYKGEKVILPIKLRKKGVKPAKPPKAQIADDGSRVFYKDGTRGISYAPKKCGGMARKTLR